MDNNIIIFPGNQVWDHKTSDGKIWLRGEGGVWEGLNRKPTWNTVELIKRKIRADNNITRRDKYFLSNSGAVGCPDSLENPVTYRVFCIELPSFLGMSGVFSEGWEYIKLWLGNKSYCTYFLASHCVKAWKAYRYSIFRFTYISRLEMIFQPGSK